MRKYVVSLILSMMLFSGAIGTAMAHTTAPLSNHGPFGCGAVYPYDYGCSDRVRWDGAVHGALTHLFVNQFTVDQAAGHDMFDGLWLTDSTSQCLVYAPFYCYMKVGVVSYTTTPLTSYIYFEYFLVGDSTPHVVQGPTLKSNDYGANATLELVYNASFDIWQVVVYLNSVPNGWSDSIGSNSFAPNHIFVGPQVQGSYSATNNVNMPENDASFNEWDSTADHFFFQTNGGTIESDNPSAPGEANPAVAKWKTVPATGNSGGSLKTCTISNC